MSPEALPASSSPPGFARFEYLGFENLPEHREYRLAVLGPAGWAEIRFRIALSAFVSGRVRLQDGPDVCFQKLLRAAAADGATPRPVVTIDDPELVAYAETHRPASKARSRPTPSSPSPSAARAPRRRFPQPPASPPAPVAAHPALEEGQRVCHALFGLGVTTSSGGGHTVIRFDEERPRTFVTSMLDVEVLSAPHTWETGRAGKNRLRVAGAPVP